jgi:pyruvate,water dikinase
LSNILWFNKISKKDTALVGGKGANLGEIFRAGFPVPNGFCVTAQAYFDFLKKTGLDKKIKQLLSGVSADNTKQLNQSSGLVKRAILRSDMPENLKKEIIQNYRKLCGKKDCYVAVRSSATAEDLPDASFAGQQSTYLDMIGSDEVVNAVKKCWASLFEARAIFYRAQNNYDHLKVGIAVPIQKMIRSETAGVMFTIDPVSNDESKLAIEAGWGLGEVVVLGEVTPDRYLVDKKSLKIVEKTVNAQDWQIVRSENGTKHVSVPKEKQNKAKLSDQQIIELTKIGIKIEKHYQFPQDNEWAIEDDKIYLVQSRPITTIKKAKNVEEPASESTDMSSKKVIVKGAAASIGIASGPAKVIHSSSQIDQVKQGDVLVTEKTNPNFVPAMKRAVAIATDTGGRTSHAAIVSRELGIPCVVGTGTATAKIKTGQIISVDGAHGIVYDGKVADQKPIISEQDAKSRVFETSEGVPATSMKVYVNLAEQELAEKTAQLPSDGVGLLRAEFMIAGIGEHPKAMIKKGKGDEFSEKLSDGILKFCNAFNPRPVIYRATDFKTNEYRDLTGGKDFEPVEANPMIGFRGAGRYLKQPEVFQLEIEAIKNARSKLDNKNLWLMIPFVRTPAEMQKIMEILKAGGLTQSDDFKIYMMCEIPANVILIDQFLDLGIDGISIGSNDLTQLMLGADRDNEILASDFDERNPSVLWAMKYVIERCSARGVAVSICGQAASTFPEIVELFCEAGATSVSVNPDTVVATRKLISSIERKVMFSKMTEMERELKEIESKMSKS